MNTLKKDFPLGGYLDGNLNMTKDHTGLDRLFLSKVVGKLF